MILFLIALPLFNMAIVEANEYAYPVDFPVCHPNSPSVSQFARYGDYPVDYSKGLIDMSVSIYDIKTKKHLVPISLNFHTSGRRPSDQSGICGLGWNLNAGGMISRKLNNMPDENTQLFTKTHNADSIFDSYSTALKNTYVGQMCYPFCGGLEYVQETQLDIFSYLLPSGKSGKFVFKQDENGIKSVVTIPYSPIDISFNYYTNYTSGFDANLCDGDYYINSFVIIDTDGTKYTFEEKQISKVELQLPEDQPDNPLLGGHKKRGVVTAWYLTKVESYDETDNIDFTYIKLKEVLLPFSETASIDYSLNCGIKYMNPIWGYEDSIESFTPIIKTINYNFGSMVFNYLKSTGSRDNRLQSITLNESGAIRNYSFTQAYNSVQKIYQLMSFTANTSSTNPMTYSFDYYNDTYRWTGNESSRDWWGFYNGQYNEYDNCMHLIPSIKSPNAYNTEIGFSYVNRRPYVEAMKLGMLRAIHYPTGGYSEFFYESNLYERDDSIGGGLRIQQVANHGNNGVIEYKTYKYGYGNMPEFFKPTKSLFSTKRYQDSYKIDNTYCLGNNITTNIVCQSDIPSSLMDFRSYFVDYNTVTEYNGTEAVNDGYTVYTYGPQWDDSYGYWNEITTNNILLGYEYPPIEFFINDPEPWCGKKLRRKTVVSKTSEDAEWIYNYAKYNFETIYSLNACCAYSILPACDEVDKTSPSYLSLYFSDFYYHNGKKLISGVELLTEEIVTKDGVTDTIHYGYSINNLQENSKTIINSDNKEIRLTKTYPSDFPNVSPYNSMIVKNIIDPVVEKRTFVNDVQTHYMKTEYSNNFSSNIFLPVAQYYQDYGQSSPELRIQYLAYDSIGNPLYIIKDGIEKVCYLWGYGGWYPVAKIEGITYTQLSNALTTLFITSLLNNTNNAEIVANLQSLRSTLNNNSETNVALVTTYTYKPLVGMLTETDPRGLTTTYEYDSYNRLKCIRDPNGKILKKMDYHYAE
jgi:YD repeat-containing protein